MSVRVVHSKRKRAASYPALHHPTRGYAVRCDRCNWRGYRNGLQCECYDEYAYYCRPWSPGPGCPSGILYRCPRCAWPNDIVRMPSRQLVTPMGPAPWWRDEAGYEPGPQSWRWFQ